MTAPNSPAADHDTVLGDVLHGALDEDIVRAASREKTLVRAWEAVLDADEREWTRIAFVPPAYQIPGERFTHADLPAKAWEATYQASNAAEAGWSPPVSVHPGLATVMVYQEATPLAGADATPGGVAAFAFVPVMGGISSTGRREYATWYTMSAHQKMLILRDGWSCALRASTVPALLQELGKAARTDPTDFRRIWCGRGETLVGALSPTLSGLGEDVPAHRTLAQLGAYG